mmetsp:Transcript_41005/g.136522  ORF Transcript_41005/g.136522 Transcript_41005/m.136522 type:complete len:93 (-) Transcript_41005:354-632(-)
MPGPKLTINDGSPQLAGSSRPSCAYRLLHAGSQIQNVLFGKKKSTKKKSKKQMHAHAPNETKRREFMRRKKQAQPTQHNDVPIQKGREARMV